MLKIDRKKCIQCGECMEFCNGNAIINIDNYPAISHKDCVECYFCLNICNGGAVYEE